MCPTRELTPTFPFAPSMIITLKLGLNLSLLTSFLYTSLLLNLMAGKSGNDIPVFSEPGGKGEEPGEAQEGTPASALELTALRKLHPYSTGKPRLHRFSCLVPAHQPVSGGGLLIKVELGSGSWSA